MLLVERWMHPVDSFQYFYRELYKGIERASTFIANVDNCLEIPETERVNMRGQARALRAYYIFIDAYVWTCAFTG